MKTLRPILVALLAMASLAPALSAADKDDLKDDLAKLQGTWKASVTTDQGSSNWTLEIKGSKTSVNIETKDGEPVWKGESEFKLEHHGKFKAYTYFNLNRIRSNGEKESVLDEGKTKSSVYKLEGDSFITISGFRGDDSDEPLLIKWERSRK